jgi:hypothetical protein
MIHGEDPMTAGPGRLPAAVGCATVLLVAGLGAGPGGVLGDLATWLSSAIRLWDGAPAQRLNGLLGFLVAVLLVHTVLRGCLLFRNDGHGLPLVGKADWYIFHAFAIDLLWIFGYSLPFVLLGAWIPALTLPVWILLVTVHLALLPFTVADHETLRFLGTHLELSVLGTYGRPASLREVFRYVASDRSVRYLPFVLVVGCIPLALLTWWALRRTLPWVTADRLSGPVILGLGVLSAIAWSFVHLVWTGTYRLVRLRPFIDTVWLGLFHTRAAPLSDAEWHDLAGRHQEAWLRRQGDDDWVFDDPRHPYVRRPRATAAPGDPAGPPPSFLLLMLESHRALHCGHLVPHGAIASATPVLDDLAARGRFWTRFSAGGLPTINALLATHLGIYQHPTRSLTYDLTTLASESFTTALGRHGYRTEFFTAADPAWDNQTPWLRQWYQGTHYDRSRESDGAMLHHLGQWMRENLSTTTPFCVSAMSATNHYPFNRVPGVQPLPRSATPQERMIATMQYTDQALGELLDAIRHEPWFDRTVIIVMGDHGFPLGEHGSSAIGYGLYAESTWIPFVVHGDHPRLPPPGSVRSVASQIDIAPTILDLAGIREPNHFLGHSLVRPHPGEDESLVLSGEQCLLVDGARRWHLPWGDLPRQQGTEVFDTLADAREERPLGSVPEADQERALRRVREAARLHVAVLEQDRLWPV